MRRAYEFPSRAFLLKGNYVLIVFPLGEFSKNSLTDRQTDRQTNLQNVIKLVVFFVLYLLACGFMKPSLAEERTDSLSLSKIPQEKLACHADLDLYAERYLLM